MARNIIDYIGTPTSLLLYPRLGWSREGKHLLNNPFERTLHQVTGALLTDDFGLINTRPFPDAEYLISDRHIEDPEQPHLPIERGIMHFSLGREFGSLILFKQERNEDRLGRLQTLLLQGFVIAIPKDKPDDEQEFIGQY